ncbi:GTPase [Dickeya fangzhongdai]|uniref:hypothetical protein n=1 Tax=Dickeya fangzhongdai TaxID=1778540 RepID=UPI000573B542|nr:hypothetical protein [Dickeya fangzhongdai]KHN52875.1 GTPase [Dickeya fangzhongdai]
MNHQTIRQQLPALVYSHLPRNTRRFRYHIFDGEPMESMLGFRIDPQPFEGMVIATTDEAIIVKTGRSHFAVLDRTLVTTIPDKGTRVAVQPYARRRFDGMRADTSEEIVEYSANGASYTVKRMVLGAAPAHLPLPTVKCHELQQLINQLENLPAPDRHRTISHMLVDAQASDFSVVDPTEDNIIQTPPAISFNVSTRKFEGRVSVLYLRADDLYAVELHRKGKRVERHDGIFFDMLGETLADRLDDGSWRKIRVRIITDSRKTMRH